MRKAIDVFEKDYDTLLLRAGEPNKICFVVREIINLSDECAKGLAKLKVWTDQSQMITPSDGK